MIVRDYYFKGGSTIVSKTDAYTGIDYVDDRDTDVHIRLVGTLKEIQKLQKDFMKDKPYLWLDEVYEYEIPKKNTYWYEHHCYGTPKKYKEIMNKISLNLKEYKKQYKKEGSFMVK